MPKQPHVHVVSQLADRDIVCYLILMPHGRKGAKVSKLQRLDGQAGYIGGNPYAVYGKLVETLFGFQPRKYQYSITVSEVNSGNILEV